LLKNTPDSYGWLSIIIHWVSALLVIGMFTLGLWMVELDFYNPWYKDAPHYHKSLGILLAVLIGLRLLAKAKQMSPKLIGKAWEQKTAKLVHWILYLGLCSLFLSGYLISTADGRGIDIFDWVTLPSMGEWFANQEDIAGDIHEWLAYSLIALVSVHALAALKHHFVNKDTTLIRIIKPLNHKKDLS
jgi:cytochrome b561